MAVDTRDKRSSAVGLALPVPRLLPTANSAVSAADRLFLNFLYSGIAAALTGTPDARTYTISAEDRTLTVLVEDRTYTIGGE